MAGFAGSAGRERARVAITGRVDGELHEDGDDAVAIVGYVRSGERAIRARELLARWRRVGPAVLDELAGEFSLAVIAGGGVWIARDRVGTRPLYVAHTRRGELAFATSMRALLAAGVPVAIDREAIACSLILGYAPAPHTAVTAIRQVGPGEYWQLAPTHRVVRYFQPRERIARGRSIASAARALDSALEVAVRTAVPPRGRIGAFLSGGLDSSLVLARLHELGHRVDAYTLHFGDRLPSELRYAQAVARHLRVPHHVLVLDARRFADALVPALVELEDLLSEPIAVPNFLLAREAARTVDVLFTGEGGDPLFGGPKNIGMVLAQLYAPHHAPALVSSYLTAHHHLYDDVSRAFTPGLARAVDFAALGARTVGGHVAETAPGDTFVGRMMTANLALKGGNNILVKVAKMVGAHDLALRSPLFAREIVELALTIPPWQKLVGTDEKLVMKRMAARSLPRPVIERPKRGMSVPLSRWFRGKLGELAHDVLTARAVRERGIFRWRYVEGLLRHEDTPAELARSRSAEKLWLVLVTELYLRTLERAPRRLRA
ncbi:MAG: asparagine synthetase B family protein [Acidobacteriota bacterium]